MIEDLESIENLSIESLLNLNNKIKEIIAKKTITSTIPIDFLPVDFLDFIIGLGVILLDSESNILACNKALNSKLLDSENKIIGKPFLEVIGPLITSNTLLDWDGIWNFIKNSDVQHSTPFSWNNVKFVYIKENRKKQEEIVNISFYPIIQEKKFFGMIGTFDFITENIERIDTQFERLDTQLTSLETELVKLESFKRQYQSLLFTVNDIVLLLSVDGNIVFANKQAKKVLGMGHDELINKNFLSIIHEEDKDKINKAFFILAGNQELEEIEYRIKTSENKYQTHRLRMSPISIGEKDLYGVMAITRDISYLKHLETELKEKIVKLDKNNQELLRLHKLKSDFLSMTSHELRTPLIPIKGYVDLILNDTINDPNEIDTTLRIVQRNTKRLNKLIQEIVELTHLESDKMDISKIEFDTHDFLKDISQELLPLLISLKVQLYIDDNKSVIYADKDLFTSAITNIITNACKYSDDLKYPEKWIRVSIDDKNDDIWTEIIIEDNGIGIPKEKLEDIFEPFLRVDHKHAKTSKNINRGGFGLGLTITKRIIDLHKGKILVYSKGEGEGTLFKVLIPKK